MKQRRITAGLIALAILLISYGSDVPLLVSLGFSILAYVIIMSFFKLGDLINEDLENFNDELKNFRE